MKSTLTLLALFAQLLHADPITKTQLFLVNEPGKELIMAEVGNFVRLQVSTPLVASNEKAEYVVSTQYPANLTRLDGAHRTKEIRRPIPGATVQQSEVYTYYFRATKADVGDISISIRRSNPINPDGISLGVEVTKVVQRVFVY